MRPSLKFRKQHVMALVAILSLVLVYLGGNAQRANAGRLGIDDELTDEQERLLSGFTSFELNPKQGQSSNPNRPAVYFPRGS